MYMRSIIVFWVIKGGHKFYDFYGRITILLYNINIILHQLVVIAATTNILSKST